MVWAVSIPASKALSLAFPTGFSVLEMRVKSIAAGAKPMMGGVLPDPKTFVHKDSAPDQTLPLFWTLPGFGTTRE
jgi:hypothetical protein